MEVEPAVRLEVLDWGGSGDTVLLLAGHGDAAHIFDEFAPRLTDQFHVVALTRRGFGASSQPDHGYDLSTMVRDIAAVADVVSPQRRLHLVGHSIAGDEMTRFAGSYPGRLATVTYLDAAYDRLDVHRIEATMPKTPPFHGPTDADLATPSAIRAYVARVTILMPESEIRATRVFDADDRFVRQVTPDKISDAVADMVEHPDYAAVRARVLAIYAVQQAPEQFLPRYTTADEDTRVVMHRIFEIWTKFATSQRAAFRRALPKARVVELLGARHALYISNENDVLRELRVFLK